MYFLKQMEKMLQNNLESMLIFRNSIFNDYILYIYRRFGGYDNSFFLNNFLIIKKLTNQNIYLN
jgi:hypothetical protein